MKKNLFILTVLILLESCSLFPPIYLNKESFFVIEEEITGTFRGTKFFFNRYNELTGISRAEKNCNLTQEHYIQCKERYQYKGREVQKEYCFFYQYNTSYELMIEYLYDCKKQEDFFLSLFSNYNKIRGAGFNIISYDNEPLNNKKFPISFYYIRGIQNQSYFEEKNYYLFLWQIGKELTIWEKM